ncbi:hypothetical protein HDU97_009874 [Phlyctochytrium planicorne]|nr:hypothetical protein HDU97_009874 [Phlyctochytrium planicorne]
MAIIIVVVGAALLHLSTASAQSYPLTSIAIRNGGVAMATDSDNQIWRSEPNGPWTLLTIAKASCITVYGRNEGFNFLKPDHTLFMQGFEIDGLGWSKGFGPIGNLKFDKMVGYLADDMRQAALDRQFLISNRALYKSSEKDCVRFDTHRGSGVWDVAVRQRVYTLEDGNLVCSSPVVETSAWICNRPSVNFDKITVSDNVLYGLTPNGALYGSMLPLTESSTFFDTFVRVPGARFLTMPRDTNAPVIINSDGRMDKNICKSGTSCFNPTAQPLPPAPAPAPAQNPTPVTPSPQSPNPDPGNPNSPGPNPDPSNSSPQPNAPGFPSLPSQASPNSSNSTLSAPVPVIGPATSSQALPPGQAQSTLVLTAVQTAVQTVVVGNPNTESQPSSNSIAPVNLSVIVGAVICVMFLIVASIIGFWFFRRKQKDKLDRQWEASIPRVPLTVVAVPAGTFRNRSSLSSEASYMSDIYEAPLASTRTYANRARSVSLPSIVEEFEDPLRDVRVRVHVDYEVDVPPIYREPVGGLEQPLYAAHNGRGGFSMLATDGSLYFNTQLNPNGWTGDGPKGNVKFMKMVANDKGALVLVGTATLWKILYQRNSAVRDVAVQNEIYTLEDGNMICTTPRDGSAIWICMKPSISVSKTTASATVLYALPPDGILYGTMLPLTSQSAIFEYCVADTWYTFPWYVK